MQWRPHLLAAGLGCRFVILHRVARDPAVRSLIRQTRETGGVVLFDIDDLVFDPEATRWHRGVSHLPPEQQVTYHDGVRRYRETLLECDAAVVPTEYLAARIRELGKPALVSRNCVDLELVELSLTALSASSDHGGPIVVGYASGSRTHDWDFAEAAGPALRRVMSRHTDVVLHTVGPIQLEPEWEAFSDRIRRTEEVDWRELPREIARFDINLAPLEAENPFCKAKSELKWLEAALCGVPTIATGTQAFVSAIRDGETGVLARTVSEWESALEELVEDVRYRQAIGRAAQEQVLANRTTTAQAPHYEALLEQAYATIRPNQVPPPASQPEESLRVNFLLPEPVKGSGGHGSIVRMAAGLAEAGHEVKVHVDRGPLLQSASDKELDRFMRRHFPPARVDYRLGRDFAPADGLIATGWTTAAAARYCDRASAGMYFVQDFEPYFQPMGHHYAAAESTYRLGLGHITLGPWLSAVLRERYDARAQPIDFGLDHSTYQWSAVPRRAQVVFYGRSTTPRRGTELGLEALRRVKAARPDVDVVLYGGERRGSDEDGFIHVGVLTPDELARLYRESMVGLALSYTNMSFVPLELMACGCAVVAVDAEPTEWFLTDGQNAALAGSDAQELANAMLRVLGDESLRTRLTVAGRKAVALLSWERSATQFEQYVQEYVAEARGASCGRASGDLRSSAGLRRLIEMDVLAAFGSTAVPLADGPVAWEMPCRQDGLTRIDVRLSADERAPQGKLTLRLLDAAGEPFEIASSTRLAADIVTGEWLPFEFEPVSSSGGRLIRVELEWVGPPSRRDVVVWCEVANAELGRPAHRSFVLLEHAAHCALASGLREELVVRRRAVAQLKLARSDYERSRLGALVQLWRRWTRPMPPPALRPWPETEPLRRKLYFGLRKYGPAAVLRELGHYMAWQSHRKGRQP